MNKKQSLAKKKKNSETLSLTNDDNLFKLEKLPDKTFISLQFVSRT